MSHPVIEDAPVVESFSSLIPCPTSLEESRYTTAGGIAITRTVEHLAGGGAIEPLIDALDARRGVLLASGFEYPGRYTRWDIGFVDPPLVLEARGRDFRLSALNERGTVLLPTLARCLETVDAVIDLAIAAEQVTGSVRAATGRFAEEERSRQPSIFSVLRALVGLFASPDDAHLGFYGAFGYDLAFQFEPIELHHERDPAQRDLVLYLPDEIIVVDHRRERAERRRYEFAGAAGDTTGLPREGASIAYASATHAPPGDHAPGEYANVVRRAREYFARGDLFEVVPSQTFAVPCTAPPSEVFRRLRERNPSPYGFLMNLGENEYLVGASPEMFVRVMGDRVETCPIAGTIARGADAIADAAQIRTLLNSAKDEAELTMCTDVDRNDKARICEPGSVRVLGRRQIEMYSRLIHTVDHVEGRLRAGFDALDAFLTHTWAVTVTGAPKTWAMQFIEQHEAAPRAWYGGAVGMVGFDGNLNTGLTLRTIRIRDGIAQVRAGATLLYDSDPDEEERETELKAGALLDAIRRPRGAVAAPVAAIDSTIGCRVLLIDHQDSFVHTLADYLRQAGAAVRTIRAPWERGHPGRNSAGWKPALQVVAALDEYAPHLVVLSPGPGTPADFGVPATIAACVARGLPVFGVCLGLQGLVEYCGGTLGQLPTPVHGKPSRIRVTAPASRLFARLPAQFTAGRYHSLYAREEALPACLQVTARSDDGIIMAVEHRTLPLCAVQFHPESLLTLEGGYGHVLIGNLLQWRIA